MIRRLDRSEDRGASLAFVLVIVTVIALIGASMLTFADTSIKSTVALRGQAAAEYAADGAAKIAVDTLQHSTFHNAEGTHCFGSDDTLPLSDAYPGQRALVKCVPDPDSGSVPINDRNTPSNAILTLGTDSHEGLNVTPFDALKVNGTVRSNSDIDVTWGSLIVKKGGVYAHTGCHGSISGDPKDCDAPVTADPHYAFEPAYDSPANAVPEYRAVPDNTSASCPGKVVTFEPGYYDDAAALSNLMSGLSPCAGSVWWFKPGTYYFDFHNEENPLLYGSDVWTVNDGQLLAGTPINADKQVLSTPSSPVRMPGACQSPLDSTASNGVQFIFGGDSQFRVTDGADVEICGSYHSNRPPIAIYGLSSGDETPTPAANVVPTSVSAVTGFSNATVANLGTVGGGYATLSGKRTGAFTLGGYAPADAVPAGSVLNSATLKVYFRSGSTVPSATRTVTLTPAPGGTPIDVSLPSVPYRTYSLSVDLDQEGRSDLARAVHDNGFTGATMTFTSTHGQSVTEYVDAVLLELGYTAPAFRAETDATVHGNCLAEEYDGSWGQGCALVTRTLRFWPLDFGSFFVQGTTYAPIAPIDLTLGAFFGRIASFGLISRTLWVDLWTRHSADLESELISVPDSQDSSTIAYLEVWVWPCTPESCNQADAKVLLRARVAISPPGGTRTVTIQSWATDR